MADTFRHSGKLCDANIICKFLVEKTVEQHFTQA